MLRLYGNTAELIRYKTTYSEQIGEEAFEGCKHCISDEHRQEIESVLTERGITYATEPVDQAGNEWVNGMEFPNYETALEAYNMGQVAWQRYCFDTNVDLQNTAMLIDVDYRLGCLEMGVN